MTLAGCSGDGLLGGGGDDGGGGGDDGGGGGGDDGGGGGDDGGGGGDDGGGGGGGQITASSGQYNHFQFEEGERYEYEVFMQNEGQGSFVWEVQEVSGGQMTVYTEYDVGETYYESTVTGQEGRIRGQVMSTPAGSFMAVALFSPATGYYQQGTLEVGNSWEASSPEGSARFEVVRKDSYAGVGCFYSELYSDGELVHESCVNPDLGLSVYSVFYDDETGDRELEMTLVNYSPAG